LGDIIISVNDKPVQRLSDLTGELDESEVGHDVKLGIKRDGRSETVNVAVVDIGHGRLGL
jgi:2-alkenal reductase